MNDLKSRVDAAINLIRGTTPDAILLDVLDTLEGRLCPACEARPGDNDYCVFDGSLHPWAEVTA